MRFILAKVVFGGIPAVIPMSSHAYATDGPADGHGGAIPHIVGTALQVPFHGTSLMGFAVMTCRSVSVRDICILARAMAF